MIFKVVHLIELLPLKISAAIGLLSENIKQSADEIRLRSGKEICVMCGKTPIFIKPILESEDISFTVKRLCNSSVYAHTNELNNGFISLPFGHRAGVVGNFSGENLYEFSSVNIRIARQVVGAADFLSGKITGGVLLAGPPASGKTTVLRDLVRQLSKEGNKVSVVDTRGEISAFSKGVIFNDLGPNTDVLFGIEKDRGIEIALRTMTPDYIAFDEIGTDLELKRVFDSVNGGAEIITTAHIGSVEQLILRPVTRRLITSGAVKTVVMLDRNKGNKIFTSEEILKCYS